MSQRATQRHVSQPILKKRSNFFFSHRIQGRAACPSFPSQCSTVRQTMAAGQHQGAGVTSPPLRLKGFKSLPLHKAVVLQKGQLDQAKDESIQLQVHLHTGLFPIAQVKGIQIHQNYPAPTPHGHPKASPPSLGKLSGSARHS